MVIKSKTVTALLFLIPSFVGFIVFSVLPILVSLGISFTNWNAMTELTLFTNPTQFFKEFGIGFSNYVALFQSKELYQTLSNTFTFVVLYVPLMLITSMGVGLILAENRLFTPILRLLFYIPVLTSWVAAALVWKWALAGDFGIVNALLKLIGIAGPAWLQDAKWAMAGIVLASVWKDMGYFGLMFFAGLKTIDKTYYEVARLDGAGPLRRFFFVTLPLLTPTLFFVITISIISSLQLFPQVMVMTPSGGPNGSTMVMVERIYTRAFTYYQMGYASALSLILFVIIFMVTFFQMKLQKRWVTYDT